MFYHFRFYFLIRLASGEEISDPYMEEYEFIHTFEEGKRSGRGRGRGRRRGRARGRGRGRGSRGGGARLPAKRRRDSDEFSLSSDSNPESDADWKPEKHWYGGDKVKKEEAEEGDDDNLEEYNFSEYDSDFNWSEDEKVKVKVKLETYESYDPDGLSCPAGGECLYSAESEEDLRAHLRELHSILPCRHCRLFYQSDAMESHVIREHTGPDEVVYFVEGEERRRKKSRRDGASSKELKRDPDDPERLLCPAEGCDFSDSSRRAIHAHLAKLHRKTRCPHCERFFNNHKLVRYR